MRRPRQAPVRAQDAEQLRRQHDVTVAAALALFDADDHAAAVDIGDLDAGGLGGAQPGGIRRGQRRTRLQARHRLQEAHDLVGAQHHRQLAPLAGMRDPLRARHQSTSRTERNDDDLAAALRDHMSRRLLFFAFATDLPPRKILEIAKARLQQIDAMAGLFERRTRGVQHEALCLPLRQRCDTRIEILGNANRQAAAGDDIIRLRRRPRKLVEAAFLIRAADFGSVG